MKNKTIFLYLGFFLLTGCTEDQPIWKFEDQLQFKDIFPLGIVVEKENIWVSDPGKNRIIKMDFNGKIVEEFSNFHRPMHISLFESNVYVPEYLNDSIKTISDEKVTVVPVPVNLDAPGGVDVSETTMAIADYYNHRVVLKQNGDIITIGKKGHNKGELFYPTDVEIHHELIYVADAYNHRVQVFDLDGKFQKMVGNNDKINVAAGLAVSGNSIYITDFYGNRVLIYHKSGKLKQVLDKHLDKPTDIYRNKNTLFITNFGEGSLTKYGKVTYP